MKSDGAEVSLAEFRSFFDAAVYSNPESISPEMMKLVLNRGTDIVGLLEKGMSWLREPLISLQPLSYAALLDRASPLLLGLARLTQHFPDDPPAGLHTVAFECSGRMIEVKPSFGGDTYELGNDCFGSLLALPQGLAKSWLWRTEGWQIPGEPVSGLSVNRKLVTHPANGWSHTDRFLDSMGKGWKKKLLPVVVEMFPDSLVPAKDEYDCDHFNFRCFLDTRPANVFSPSGDQFFVVSTRRDQIVYHARAGDLANLRVLHDPVDAIDRYSAHTLRNLSGEFDFSPWSEPYKP